MDPPTGIYTLWVGHHNRGALHINRRSIKGLLQFCCVSARVCSGCKLDISSAFINSGRVSGRHLTVRPFSQTSPLIWLLMHDLCPPGLASYGSVGLQSDLITTRGTQRNNRFKLEECYRMKVNIASLIQPVPHVMLWFIWNTTVLDVRSHWRTSTKKMMN